MKSKSGIQFFIVIVISAFLCSCEKVSYMAPDLTGEYAVFAWNDQGMHSLNPTFDKMVLSPPYNTVMAQVVKRGNPPSIVNSGITVSYRLINNTTSSNKRAYGGFWTNSLKLFGVTLANNIGLKGFGLSGTMVATGNHFIAEAIPAVPVSDDAVWDPYQVAEITVKDAGGKVLARTQATVPVSDEINCAKCHGPNPFDDILEIHDSNYGTRYSVPANQPILCAICHPSPALGKNTGPEIYLSQAIHGSHANFAGITCNDCHPGVTTKFNRSIEHTSDDGNCVECHGNMASIASTISSGRIPWTNEPTCAMCHSGVTGVSTGTELYKNSSGHGDFYCSACHGSPHAMYPSNLAQDNYQSNQFQGYSDAAKTIGSCGICHESSRGVSNLDDFNELHGGSTPRKKIGCHACHTVVNSTTADWPHAFKWNNSN
jgi:hypothetical protein